MITIEKSDPTSAESQRLIAQLSAVLAAITGDEGKGHFSSDTLSAPRALWALARNHHGVAIGCGAIRPLSASTAEVKRVFSTGEIPGTGAALMRFLKRMPCCWAIAISGWRPALLTAAPWRFTAVRAITSSIIIAIMLAVRRRSVWQSGSILANKRCSSQIHCHNADDALL